METFYITHPHKFIREENSEKVLALGFFDGVHIGHQEVIGNAREIANDLGAEAAVMTFNPHPLVVLSNGKKKVDYLIPLEERLEQIAALGIDKCYVVEFDKTFAGLTPQQFVDEYIISLNVVHVVAGFDFSYGTLGRGTMETLPFHSRGTFEHTVVGKVQRSEEKISSTLIRQLILDGNVDSIPFYLGRKYRVSGIVVEGEQRGRKIGFPTANIKLDDNFICPQDGVYCVELQINNETFNGVCNIGKKPTFHEQFDKTIEVHLLDFSKDIYGEKVTIEWHKRLRSEMKFNSVNELKEQIQLDTNKAKAYFNNR